jgi:M6 family metalloprotease-like protein
MRQALVILVVMSVVSLSARAAPVYPREVTLRQPDGTTFIAIPFGDEWANGLRTLQGHLITQDRLTGQWVYARPRDGRLEPTGRVVGRDSPPLQALQALGRSPQAQERQRARAAPRLSAAAGPAAVGSQPVLVILVAFQNQGPVGTTPEHWREKIFGETRSVADYYREVSYGQLVLVPAAESHGTPDDGIVGWLTLPQDHPDMRGDLGSATETLAQAALTAADEFVDFASFDKNADGAISTDELHILIVAAGYDTSYGGETSCSPSVWGHQTSFLLTVPTFDGVKIGDPMRRGGYIELGEWHCQANDTPGHPATIGVLVHEFGHDLGRSAPDLYDSDGSSYGIGNWDVMAHGAWNTTDLPGDTPAHPSVWVKAFFGWLTPHVMTAGERQLALAPIEQAPDAWQLLANPNGIEWNWGDSPAVGEYFLLEYRQKMGYDAALPGEGLLIWYIDESQVDNDDESRRLVDLLEADGQNNLKCRGQPQCNKGDVGDPFPGATNNRTFGKDTTPSSNLRNGFPSGVELTQIGLSGSTVAARARVGAVNNDNLLLFADAFDGPEDGWIVNVPWTLQSATACQSAAGAPASGSVWYHGTSDCQYNTVGSLFSPTISIPPGTKYIRIAFSTLIKLQRGDRAEIWAHFNGDLKRLVYRRSATRGWMTVDRRLRVPNGVSEMYLEFFVRQSRGTRRSPAAPPVGWWLDNLEVRTDPPRSRSSEGVFSAPGREELPRPLIETRLDRSGALQVFALHPTREIELRVYDLAGRMVATATSAGSELLYTGHDERGQRLAKGVYLYVVTLYGRDGSVWRSEVRKLVVK